MGKHDQREDRAEGGPRRVAWPILVGGGVVAALLAWFGVAAFLGPRSEEDRIRAVISAIEAGIEEKDVGDVIEHIDQTYKDRSGLDRQGLRLFLVRLLFRKKEMRVQRLGRTEVEITPPDRATARFRAVLSEGLDLNALRTAGDYEFEVQFRKSPEDGEWKVTGHKRAAR